MVSKLEIIVMTIFWLLISFFSVVLYRIKHSIKGKAIDSEDIVIMWLPIVNVFILLDLIACFTSGYFTEKKNQGSKIFNKIK